MRASAVDEPLQAIREEEVLMTSTPLTGKVVTMAEVHQFKGHPSGNGQSEFETSEGIENGETPISKRRGGGEVIPGDKGQGGQGQGASQGDQRGAAGRGRGNTTNIPDLLCKGRNNMTLAKLLLRIYSLLMSQDVQLYIKQKLQFSAESKS